MTDYINTFFENGLFPDFLKEANVTSIYEKDDPLDKENYRPVCILPLLSKVFEKLIYKQLSIYTELFMSFILFGFRKALFGFQYPTFFIQVTSFLTKRAGVQF